MSAADQLDAIAARLTASTRTAMDAAAEAMAAAAADEGRRAGGPLRGKRHGRPIPLEANTDVRVAGDVTICRLQGVSPGAWVWVTAGTRPHDIPRRRDGTLAELTVRHPGTVGRNAWHHVRDRCTVLVPAIFRDAVHQAVTGT